MAESSTSSYSLFHYLDAVHVRPGMYTGVDSADRTAQLDRIELLIAGYTQAVTFHGIRDPGVGAYSGFGQYLERRFGWNIQAGPIGTIRRESDSDDAAWETFWRLLADFRESAV